MIYLFDPEVMKFGLSVFYYWRGMTLIMHITNIKTSDQIFLKLLIKYPNKKQFLVILSCKLILTDSLHSWNSNNCNNILCQWSQTKSPSCIYIYIYIYIFSKSLNTCLYFCLTKIFKYAYQTPKFQIIKNVIIIKK